MDENIKKSFDREGFAVLPNFYSEEQIDAALALIQDKKSERSLQITVDLLDTGERTSLGLLTRAEVSNRRMKVNDLFLDMPEVRELALSKPLVPTLNSLLENPVALCNSLYFENGSAQPPHVDGLYMTPRTPGHLIAIWVALEDAHPDAGQLFYYPGSHLIEQHIFSNGTRHFVQDEMPVWESYIMGEVENRGLRRQVFSAKKGDVLIWHANLLHGGSQILNLEKTRKSLVFHYYSQQDATFNGYKLVEQNQGFWTDRAPQALPVEASKRVAWEISYRSKNPDVEQAIRAGLFDSGRHHYELFGEAEGRSI